MQITRPGGLEVSRIGLGVMGCPRMTPAPDAPAFGDRHAEADMAVIDH